MCRVTTGGGERAADRLRRAQRARGPHGAARASSARELPGGIEIKAREAARRGIGGHAVLGARTRPRREPDGILELPARAPVGRDLRDALDLDDASSRST